MYGTAVQGQELPEIETTSREGEKEMKLYRNTGHNGYVSVNDSGAQFYTLGDGGWITALSDADLTNDSEWELVYESPEHKPERIVKKPIEIDGYWVARREEYNDVAAWGSRDLTGIPATDAISLEDAYGKIKEYTGLTYMRKYIPALLAIVKFFEQEDQ